MTILRLLHGSNHIIKSPSFSFGNIHNDYGQGFYCTEDMELAKEWACKENINGYVNHYIFNSENLKILNLLDGNYSVLNWIAILLKYRTFTLDNEISIAAKDYIIKNFLIDISNYDVVIGYRADDSYFSYAQSFLNNSISIKQLSKALMLGNLGNQFVLISKEAFNRIVYIQANQINKVNSYPKYISRDTNARETYIKHIKNKRNIKNDIYVLDILREGIKNNDPRIQ